MSALLAMGKHLADEEMWREYMAAMAYCSAKAQYKDFPFEPYSEMKRGTQERDTRTAQQIKADVLSELRGDKK